MTRGHWLDPFKKWQPPGCLMYQYTGKDIRACLNGERIVYIGDSTTRQLFWATAKKLNATGATAYGLEVDKHGDLSFEDVHFVWDPFLNSSSLRAELLSSLDDSIPEDADPAERAGLITVGGGLWYARHFQSDWLDRFRDALDHVVPLLGASKSNPSLYHPPSSGKGSKVHHVYMTPIQVPLYDSLSPSRASTITPTKITSMNEYLFNLSTTKGIKVPWSHSLMTWESQHAYEAGGLHVTEDVAIRKVDVLLNARCNSQMTYRQGYPFNKTCCSAYVSQHPLRTYFFYLALVLLPSLIIGIQIYRTSQPTPAGGLRHYGGGPSINTLPAIELLRAFTVLTVVLTYCVLADRTQLFEKSQKHFNYQEFSGLCAIVLVLGLLSVRPILEKKTPAGDALSKSQSAEPPFLSRDQSDEWKGWMQFVILIYHYTGASSVLGIYQLIRILVASYLFLTGFGHTIFFYRKQDYSMSRCASVLVRYNLLSCVLPYIMDTDYLFYYFAPLVSFWYLVVYLTMRIRSSKNLSMPFLLSKIGVSAAIMTLFARTPILFEGIFLLLEHTCNIHWNVKEWQFRLQLDCYIVYGGMVAAIVYCQVTDILCGQSFPQNTLSGIIRRHWNKIRCVSVAVALITLAGFGYFVQQFSDKIMYNRWVPFVSLWPILAFVVLRNCNRHFRNLYSSAFAWLGRCSLETFTLQFHIWLAADTKGLLSLGIFGRKGTHVDGRYQDLVILTGVFLWLSWMTADATTTITNWIIDPRRHSVQDIKPPTTLTIVTSDTGLDAFAEGLNVGRARPGAFSRHLKKWYELWMGKLEFRLGSIILIMWMLNMV
ncbi:MAG: hypothetical protein Q9226_007328 [Calogaya cf. arnoldii]